jgi:hypothetical protein
MVLHAGKFEMREIYLEKRERTTSLTDYPRYFTEWVGYGLRNLGLGKPGEERKEDVSSAKERAALIQLLIRIQSNTPAKVPFLEGESYRLIPSMLIPRVLSPGKAVAHTGNMILSLHYGILDEVGIWKTSVAFDPIMEAYANYGFLGVAVLAILFGFFIGWSTRLTIHVPMLSFGFLFGVQVIASVVASFNTAGVFVTTVWQSFLALCGLSLFLMSKQNNPVWKYYALKLAEKLKFKKDPKLEKTSQEVEATVGATTGYGLQAAGDTGQINGLGIEDRGLGDASKAESEMRKAEAAPVRHERPTRFVYGSKKK